MARPIAIKVSMNKGLLVVALLPPSVASPDALSRSIPPQAGDRDADVVGACIAGLVLHDEDRFLPMAIERLRGENEALVEAMALALGEARIDAIIEPVGDGVREPAPGARTGTLLPAPPPARPGRGSARVGGYPGGGIVQGFGAGGEQGDLSAHALARTDPACHPGFFQRTPAGQAKVRQQFISHIPGRDGAIEITQNGPGGHAIPARIEDGSV